MSQSAERIRTIAEMPAQRPKTPRPPRCPHPAWRAMFLIIQDGRIFYHARAMGFEFAEHSE